MFGCWLVVGLPALGLAQSVLPGMPVVPAYAPPSALIPVPAAATIEAVPPPPPTIPSALVPGILALPPPAAPAPALLELRPTVTLAEEFTSNFTLAAERPQANLRSSLSPGATLVINQPVLRGEIQGALTPAHDTATDGVSLFGSLAARLAWEATPRLVLSVWDALTHSDEPTLADRLSLRARRQTFTDNILGLGARYRLDRLETQAYYRLSSFSDDTGVATVAHVLGLGGQASLGETSRADLQYEYLSSDTSGEPGVTGHRVVGALDRQLNRLASGGLTGSYAFRTETRDQAGGASDFHMWTAAAFAGYGIPGRWSVAASVGFAQVADDSGIVDASPTAVVALTYWPARGSVSLHLERGLSETFSEGENFGVVRTQGVGLRLSYPLTPALTVAAGASYRENRFTGLGGEARDANDESHDASASLSFRATRWLTIGLEYDYRHASPSGDGRGFVEHRVRASLGAAF
jgi:hypothetical protein